MAAKWVQSRELSLQNQVLRIILDDKHIQVSIVQLDHLSQFSAWSNSLESKQLFGQSLNYMDDFFLDKGFKPFQMGRLFNKWEFIMVLKINE